MGNWRKHPRKDEQIGGGYIVLRRHRSSGRVSPGDMAFEHPSAAAAAIEAIRLKGLHADQTFEVWQRVFEMKPEAVEAVPAATEGAA